MFENIKGHARQKAILERQLRKKSLSHAYLFTGEEGIGKRTLAEDFARKVIESGLEENRSVNIDHADILRIGYSGEGIKISEVRNIIADTSIRPLEGTNRVVIIDHAEKINPLAQNALLKTIEEPQPGNVFILITDNPSELLDTIKSRCQALPFKDIPVSDKREILESEGLTYDGDITLPVGQILENIKSPERETQFRGLYNRFLDITDGQADKIFPLAEEIASDSSLAREVILYFIRREYRRLIEDGENSLFSIETLFELYDKLSYNVNLRLQIESCLISIFTEYQDGKKYSRGQVSGIG